MDYCLVAANGLLTVEASLVAEHRLEACRLSSCGIQTQLSCGMQNLLGPRINSTSPALAGGFLTTRPPGKSTYTHFWISLSVDFYAEVAL